MRKRIRSKAVALTLACTLLAGLVPTAGAAATDTAQHWAEPTVTQWMKEGFIEGYEDGSFRPDHSITRAEAAVLINRKFNLTKAEKSVDFPDLPESDWAFSPLRTAVEAGYMQGYEDGTIRPKGAVTRQELAVMIAGLLRLPSSERAAAFTDADAIPEWSKKQIAAAAAHGIMEGYGDGSFAPTRTLTRAEAVVTLERASKRRSQLEPVAYHTAGTFGPEQGIESIHRDVIVTAPGVTLRNMAISGSLLLGEGIGEGDVTLQNVTVRGQTTVKGGGANSIHLEHSTLGDIVVNKVGSLVRIVAKGTTKVQTVEVRSAVSMEEDGVEGEGFTKVVLGSELPEGLEVKLSGEFQGVQLASKGTKVQLIKGAITELNVAAGASQNRITLGPEAVVKVLETNAVLQVDGQGTIEKATVNEGAAGTTFEKQPATTVTGTTPVPVSGGFGGGSSGDTSSPQPAPAALTISTAITGYNKLGVSFSRQVDPAATEIALARTTNEIEQIQYTDNYTKAIIRFKQALTEGSFTVVVKSGGTVAAEQSVTAQNERIVEFRYVLDTAVWDPGAPRQMKVKFTLWNQYGEDVTARYSQAVKVSIHPDVLTAAHPAPVDGTAVLSFHRELSENERVMVYAFYGSSMKLKKELTVSRIETPSTSAGIPFITPSYTVKGLYHPANETLTVNSNFSEFRVLFRWIGDTGVLSENFTVVVSDPSVLNVQKNSQGPVFGTVTVNGENWSSMTLTRGASPIAGTNTIYLIDNSTGLTATIVVNVNAAPATQPAEGALFIVGDKLIVATPDAGSAAATSWTVRNSVTQAVYQANFMSSTQDTVFYAIEGGLLPSEMYTALRAGSTTEQEVVLAGSVTVNQSVYAKVSYGGTKPLLTVINATYQDPAAANQLAPLAVNDVLRVFYDKKYMLTSVWDGTSWVFQQAAANPVAAPAQVSAVTVSNREIGLSWSAVSNADYYRIYYSTTATGELLPLKDAQGNLVKVTGAVTYTDNTLEPNTTRYYVVKAAMGGNQWEFESQPSSMVSATTYYNEHIKLDFAVTDSVQHPTQPILYFTDKANNKLHAVNYETGAKTSLALPLQPESVTFASNKVYVALLKHEHSSYRDEADQQGSVAVVDAASMTLLQTFDTAIDPYDLAVDRSGYVYVASGSGQWTYLKSYHPTAFTEVASSGIRQASYLHMHPTLDRVYAIDTDSSPRDMEVFPVSNGAFTPAGYDSPYHGEHTLSTTMRISPDGSYLFNGAGKVFQASSQQAMDMKYVYGLNSSFTDIAFELNKGSFYTAKDKLVGAYRYDNFQPSGTFHADGLTKALYNSPDRLLTVSMIGNRYVVELINKTDMVIIPPADNQQVTFFGTVTDMVYAPSAQKAYALDESFNKLYVVDLAGNTIERTVALTYKPSELTVSEDGTKLYIRNNDPGAMVTEISLSDLTQVRHLTYSNAPQDYSDQAHGQIYQRGDKLFVVTGEWAPRLLAFNAATFAKINYGTEITAVGDAAFSSDNTKLYYWYQYGWSAGQAGTDVYEISIGATPFAETDRSQIGYAGSFLRDPLDTPMLLIESRALAIAKNRVLNMNNLNQVVAELPEPIYAVSPDGSKLVGKTGLYDAVTFQKLQTLNLNGASHFFYAGGTLYYIQNNTLQHL